MRLGALGRSDNADGPGGGVEVHTHLDEPPPVCGVRDKVSPAECLPVGTASQTNLEAV